VFLVGEQGAPYAVKIVDFGFAKTPDMTPVPGLAVGTIPYMAPEQTVSDPVNESTDVYGLGFLMYRMFSGALPWADVADAELLAHQLAVRPPPPDVEARGLDPRLDKVILKALRKNPRNRYRTMDELLEDVERIGGLRPGSLRADSPDGEPDVYVPRSEYGVTAGRFLCKRIGLSAPF
jgi:serine/threonine-protein kinase